MPKWTLRCQHADSIAATIESKRTLKKLVQNRPSDTRRLMCKPGIHTHSHSHSLSGMDSFNVLTRGDPFGARPDLRRLAAHAAAPHNADEKMYADEPRIRFQLHIAISTL